MTESCYMCAKPGTSQNRLVQPCSNSHCKSKLHNECMNLLLDSNIRKCNVCDSYMEPKRFTIGSSINFFHRAKFYLLNIVFIFFMWVGLFFMIFARNSVDIIRCVVSNSTDINCGKTVPGILIYCLIYFVTCVIAYLLIYEIGNSNHVLRTIGFCSASILLVGTSHVVGYFVPKLFGVELVFFSLNTCTLGLGILFVVVSVGCLIYVAIKPLCELCKK